MLLLPAGGLAALIVIVSSSTPDIMLES